MPDSTREAAIKGLFTTLQTIAGPTVTRNQGYPSEIPSAGLIDLRDGDPGEPVDITISIVTYEYNHEAEVNVVVKDRIQSDRDSEMDALLQAIGTAIDADPTLGGTVEHAEVTDTQPITFEEEGSSTRKGVTVLVLLNYITTSPVL